MEGITNCARCALHCSLRLWAGCSHRHPPANRWAECAPYWRSTASGIVGCKCDSLPLRTSLCHSSLLPSASDHNIHGFDGRDDVSDYNAACPVAGEYLYGCNRDDGKRGILVWERLI